MRKGFFFKYCDADKCFPDFSNDGFTIIGQIQFISAKNYIKFIILQMYVC